MIRAVLDVVCLVSGTLTPSGPCGEIIDAWRSQAFALVISAAILEEYEEVLRRPRIARKYKVVTNETIAASATLFRTFGILVNPSRLPRVVQADPNDDVILACAIEGAGDFIVTRDRHLLDIQEYQGMRIVAPEEFLRLMRAKGAKRSKS